MPFIPPWLVGTDPVAMYAEGLRMGQSQAGEAARIQASQEAAMRENQRMAVEEQIRSQELGLRMQEQAARDRAEQRKQQALARYQMALATGTDPAKALLQVAPDLGESLTGAAQLYRATQPAAMTPYQQAEIELRKEEEKRRSKEAGPASIVTHDEFPGVKFLRQPTGHEQLLSDKEPTQIQKDRMMLEAAKMMQPTSMSDVASPEWQQQTNRAAQVLARYSTPETPKSPSAAKSDDLVSVINPKGKRVKIRKSDLDSALTQGYKKVDASD